MAMSALSDLVTEYLDELAPRVGGHTLALRRTACARVLVPWADREGIAEVGDLDRKALARFSGRLQREPGPKGKMLAEQTVKTYGLQVDLFLNWAAKNAGGAAGLHVESPPLRSGRLSARDLLSWEQVQAMEDAAATPRNKLIVRLLADTGIRVGELVHLRPCDIISRGGHYFIAVWGKEGGRTLGIQPGLYRRLKAYIDGGRKGGDEEGPLFVALARNGRSAGRNLSVSGVEQVVKELARLAGIRKRVYPHLLRHSYATEFYRGTRDAKMLKEILGHTDLRMIDKVYVSLTDDDVHDAMLEHLKGRTKAKGKG